MREIINKTQAVNKGIKYFFSGEPCKYGHVDKRYASNSYCVVCAKSRQQTRYNNNADEIKQQYQLNRDSILAKKRKHYHENREYYQQQDRDRYNPEQRREWYKKNAEQRREKMRQWRKQNPEKYAAYSERRRGYLKDLTPKDANMKAIKEIYLERDRLTKETGIQHHVDHIQPLSKGGLHEENNLQVITAKENLRKGNKTEN